MRGRHGSLIRTTSSFSRPSSTTLRWRTIEVRPGLDLTCFLAAQQLDRSGRGDGYWYHQWLSLDIKSGGGGDDSMERLNDLPTRRDEEEDFGAKGAERGRR